MSLSRLRCFLMGHRWLKVMNDEADTSGGFFLRCQRCAAEKPKESSGVMGAVGWGMRGPPP
jgi:hypothetical protein